MTDLFKLILGMLASLFQSRAKLEAENLVLRQQINALVGLTYLAWSSRYFAD